MIAFLEPVNTIADFPDDPGTFVSTNNGQMGHGRVASRDMVVAVAEARRNHLD